MIQVKIIYFDDISGVRPDRFEAGPYNPDQAKKVVDNLLLMGARDVKIVKHETKRKAA